MLEKCWKNVGKESDNVIAICNGIVTDIAICDRIIEGMELG